MPLDLKFNFKDLIAFDRDLAASAKVMATVAQKVLREHLGPLRSEFRAMIPRDRGRLARHFNFWVRKKGGFVSARFGFLINKSVSANTAIAANVLQKGGAQPRKGRFLWIPLPGNRNADGSAVITPRQLLDQGGFIATSSAGNVIAFRRFGKQAVPSFVLKTFIRFNRAPLPIEPRIQKEAPLIGDDIADTLGQVLEARKKVESISG